MDGARGDAVTGRGDGADDRRRSGSRKPQSTSAAHGTTRSTPVYLSRSVAPSGPTDRSRLRRSMRTPAWARRTLAGARSPERASSLPAMLSCVTSTARPPSSSARATAMGPPIGSNSTMSPRSGNAASPRRSAATSTTRAPSANVVLAGAGLAAGALHDAPAGRDVRRRRPHVDAEPGDLGGEPGDEVAVRAGDGGQPAERRRLLDERDVMAAGRGDACGLQAGGAAADDRDVAGHGGRGRPVGVLGLAARRGLADARDQRVAGVADLARLVAAGARPDLLGRAGTQLGDEVGVGDLGPGHLDRRADRPDRRSRRAPTPPGRRRRPNPAGPRARRRPPRSSPRGRR